MKNTLALALVLFASANLFQPKTANAGLLIGTFAGNAGGGTLIGLGFGAAAGVGNAFLNPKAHDDFYTLVALAIYTPILAVGGAVLDIDAVLPTESLVKEFKTRYPFLNNAEDLSALAVQAKTKLNSAVLSAPHSTSYFVSFAREEVQFLLQGSALSDAQLDQIASDLK